LQFGAENQREKLVSAPIVEQEELDVGAETLADRTQKASEWVKNRANQQDRVAAVVMFLIFALWHKICYSWDVLSVLRRSSNVLNSQANSRFGDPA
jgi:hypothetical protein